MEPGVIRDTFSDHDAIYYQVRGQGRLTGFDFLNQRVFERTLEDPHVFHLYFSPDGQYALTTSPFDRSRLLDARTFQPLDPLDTLNFSSVGTEIWLDGSRSWFADGRVTDPRTRLGLTLPAFKSLLHRFRLRYRELLLDEVGQTVGTRSDVAEELRGLLQTLRDG